MTNCASCGRIVAGNPANKHDAFPLCYKCHAEINLIANRWPSAKEIKKGLVTEFRLQGKTPFTLDMQEEKPEPKRLRSYCMAEIDKVKQQLRCKECGIIISSLNKFKPYCSAGCMASGIEKINVKDADEEVKNVCCAVCGKEVDLNVKDWPKDKPYFCMDCEVRGRVIPRNLAVKADDGKNPLDLLPTVALESVGLVLEHGARKYAAHNWRKGMNYSRLISALLRHVFAFMRGENIDPESNLPHMAHAACCVLFLLDYQLTSVGEDDRYQK